jgi:hypothetical protein
MNYAHSGWVFFFGALSGTNVLLAIENVRMRRYKDAVLPALAAIAAAAFGAWLS